MPNAREVKPGLWRVEWRDTRRKRRSVRVQAKTKTEAYLNAGITKADTDAPQSMPLSAAIDRMYKDKWRHNKDGDHTKRRALKWVDLIGDRQLHEITPQDVQRGISKLDEGGLMGSTINRDVAALRAVLNMAHKAWCIVDRVPHLPTRKETAKRIRWLSHTEETNLLLALQDEPETYDLVVFLLDTGWRIGEALTLEWADVTDTSVTTWENKTDHPRTTPLTKRVQTMLAERKPNGNRRVFLYEYRYHWERFTHACTASGLRDVTPHTLRHTCASRLVQAGVPLFEVMTWLGHKDMKTTMIYAHLAPNVLDRAKSVLERQA